MQKRLVKILLCCLFIFGIKGVNAEECNSQKKVELQNEAAKVTLKTSTKQIVDENFDCEEDLKDENGSCNSTRDIYEVNILNLTKNLYLEISNNVTDEIKIITYDDVVDDIATFDWDHMDEVTKFTVKVYGSSDSGCYKEYLAQNFVTALRKNEYADYGICDDQSDYYLCDEYVDFDEMNYDEFSTLLQKHIDGEDEENQSNETKDFRDKFSDFIKEYGIWIVLLLMTIGGVSYTVINRKKSGK